MSTELFTGIPHYQSWHGPLASLFFGVSIELFKGVPHYSPSLRIQRALRPLVELYPACPLAFLFKRVEGDEAAEGQHLTLLRRIVGQMFDRAARPTVMTQATFIWLAFDAGVLKVAHGLTLAEFPKIEEYPTTDVSRKIASSIRAGIQVFFAEDQFSGGKEWSRYFWNRGLEIDECLLGEERSESTERP